MRAIFYLACFVTILVLIPIAWATPKTPILKPLVVLVVVAMAAFFWFVAAP